MNEQNDVTIEIIPTIFPQCNAKNNLAADHKTSSLSVKRLKHGHLRSMQRLNEDEQIHFLMSQLTELSPTDLDELDIEDSAKLSEVIFGFMRRYAQMAKEIAR
jgi:hypothetical protein